MSQQDMEDLSEISEAVEDCATKMDILGNLPIEILCEVLLYLSPRDLQNVWSCCGLWRNDMEFFWKRKCKMENYFECEDDLNSEFYRNFVKGLSHWEGIFMYNSKLKENWINLKCKEKSLIFTGKNSRIHNFCGDVIIISALTNEVMVINCNTGAVEKRIKLLACTDSDIREIEKNGNQLIVVETKEMCNGNPNYLPIDMIELFDIEDWIDDIRLRSTVIYVRIWNFETGELLKELEEEIPFKIQQMIIYKDIIALLQYPCGVCIFNYTKQAVEYEKSCPTSVCLYDDKIALGNHLGKILIMDLDYTELMTLQCCSSPNLSENRMISKIQMVGNYLISMCVKGSLRKAQACIWNINTKTKLYVIPNVVERDLSIFLKENRLCYRIKPYGVKLCRLDTGECLMKLEYIDVVINNFFIINGNYDKPWLLKMWSITTGELVADLDAPEFPWKCLASEMNNPNPRSASKSKIAYFDYDDCDTQYMRKDFPERPDMATLKIIDFQAQIH